MVKSCRTIKEVKEDAPFRKSKLLSVEPFQCLIPYTDVRAKGSDLRVHFKNTFETAAAIRGQSFTAARKYLEDVLEHKRCIPYRRYNGGIGRTGQAAEFNTTQGRWPEKSIRRILDLFQNIEANAEAKKIDPDSLYIWHIAVQRAQKGRRRTYRAHGRINPYMSNPCHIEIICKPIYKGGVEKVGNLAIRMSRKANKARYLKIGA